jgi:dihydroneopterin aldolase
MLKDILAQKEFIDLLKIFMPDLLTISLNNVRFRAYHGLYPEERQKGNDFVVNMQVSYLPKTGTILSLEDTIDYAALFEIINTTMQKPVDLLETLVQTIAHSVHREFRQVKEVTVSVEKLNPPIDKFSGSATVSYHKTF